MFSSNVRRLGLLTAVIAAAALVAPTATTAAAATGSTVIGVASGRCLDVVGNSTAAKTRVNIYDCNGQANQAWTFTTAGELRVYDAAMCLDVAGASTTSPADAQIYPCTGGANQKWRINADGSITGVQSGLCLDVTGAGTANSTLVGLYTCNGGGNQKWRTSLGDTQPPSVPADPRVSDLVCDAVTFSWNAATDNVGVAFYDVYHDGQLMKSVSTLSTSLTVVGGVTWGLYVNARDAAGNVSQASATVPITPPQCQPDTQAPSAPTKLAGSASGTTVTLNWTAATDNIGVRAYDVYRGGAKVGAVTGTATAPPATTFVDSGLAANTSYAYHVVARDAQANVSAPSATTTVTTGAACGDSVCAVTQIATDTDIPWGLVTLPDGTILYTRRDAHDIVHLNPATGAKTSVGTVPGVDNTDGEGGLLGLAVSAGFAGDHWLYIMHTSPSDNRIVRIKLENDQLGTEQVLLSGLLRNKFHNGGRLRFGPDGKLYASTGDAQNGDNAQNKASLNGKVLRLNPDGTVPSDNPFGNYVWSYGHRNPQGLAFDSQGRLWEQEFGNAVMDETNLITRGGNYGWPACEGTSGTCGTAGFIAPKRTYSTAEGSCSGIAIVRDVLYVACERGTRMYREVISGSDLTNVQAYFNGTYGRLRTVEPAPDGGLWLTTTNNGDKDSIPGNSNERIFHVALGG
ncbi:PQQ-dependent sugar dehydrogenase [Amycolatopsis sp. A133]|uniref:PQQ-dependent sugar dehydrogenase n=1 Tax=Amycolatopsis sp. A133 TaxID=3064472 RepID=UPI0027F44247|nr:PQQ-dependent sugar dehydrogenase [Amycolatopsis sp. A133]MDQ7807557.1 PQQ-dependent sugar dehydrogenase [Amycolatopsis sp. A133]